MDYISNSFSLNMVNSADLGNVRFESLTLNEAAQIIDGCKSVVGHEDTAAVISTLVGSDVEFNRQTVMLRGGDSLLVAQYKGPRLTEGATTLPEGSTIEWVKVTL